MFYKKNKDKVHIIFNMDDVPVIDLEKETFLLAFNKEQTMALMYCLDKGYDISPIAYEGLPATYMRLYIDIVYEQGTDEYITQKSPARLGVNSLNPLDIWKIIHTELTYEQFRWILMSLIFGMKILDEIKEARLVDVSILEALFTGIRYGKNFCSEVKETMDIPSFINKVYDYQLECERCFCRKTKYNDFICKSLY